MKKAKATTKKDAIVIAMQDYLNRQKILGLKALIGNYESFGFGLEDLKKDRDAR